MDHGRGFGVRTEPGMRHAAARALAAAAAGIILGRVCSVPVWVVIAGLVVAVASARLTRGWSLYLAVAAAALVYAQYRTSAPVDPRLYAVDRFEGTIESGSVAGTARRAVVSLARPWRGKVTLWLRDSTPVLEPGDVVRVFGRIDPLAFPRNPGVSDFNSVLAARGFVGSASATTANTVLLARGKGPFLLNRVVAPVRAYIFGVVDRFLPGSEGSLFAGLLLGGSQGLPKDVQEAFRDAGIVHILAVSGMNVSIVVGVVWLMLSLLGVRGWWRFGVGVAGVVFYMLLVGFSGAPMRAGVMAVAVMLSVPTQRRVSTVASLCSAGILLLLIDPAMLFDAGAQLSFAATLGIVLVAGPAQQLVGRAVRLRRLGRWVLAPVVVSVAATLFTAPLLLHHFSRVQPLAFMTSAAVVPLVGLAMPLGMIVLIVNLVSHWLASVFAQSLWLVLFLLLKLTVFMGRLDWAIWEPGCLPWVWVAWAYALGLLALRLRREPVRVWFAAVLLAGLSVMAWQSATRRPVNSMTFLDPGQGDAMLLEDSLGRRVLFDAGVNRTGALRDYLRSRGIHTLDAVVVTHPDNDHYGGLLDLPERFRIRQLLVSSTESQDPDYRGLLARLRERGTEVVVAGKGTHLSGLGFQVDFIWPDDATRAQFLAGTARTNDISLVATVAHGEFRMLLTGDLDKPDLLARLDAGADLLKSPHHGSLRGNPEVLYTKAQPRYVVVMGRYPTPAKLERRFEGTGVNYINTRVDGAVALRFESGQPVIQRFFGRLPFPAE
ncbi:ComEC/Rec2 family competence protein [candidate division WOR-3 bacterium]|nr:ComEC/Rec2 family competence protein [candidate division WOR-3 bacterium]